jgi:hypothetical protein
MPELIRPELKLNGTDILGNTLYGYTNYDGIPRRVKNIFLSVEIDKIWLDKLDTWYGYVINHDDTPESIAENYYNDSRLYWVILMLNGINNKYDEWPQKEEFLIRRLKFEFGDIRTAKLSIHHYTHSLMGYDISETTYNFLHNSDKNKSNMFKPVSEYDYLFKQNEKNRKIKLLRPVHIKPFVLTLKETYNLFG